MNIRRYPSGAPLGAVLERARAICLALLIPLVLVLPVHARDIDSGTPAVASPAAAEATPQGNMADTPVLAYYYIWFNPDSWERAKTDFPVLGRYSSDDAEVMRQHVRWAKNAGIDGFIVSWKNTDVLTSRLRTLIAICEEEDFKLAIIYQGLDVERDPLPAPRIAADLDFFVREFGENPVFDLFPKPLVIWSGTWEFSRDDIDLVTAPRREQLLILASERNPDDYRNIADLIDGDAYYWSSVDPDTYPKYLEKLQAMESAIHQNNGLWIAPAAPGFDARLLGGDRVVNRKSGDTLRTQMDAAAQSSPDAIGLISWNEFSENSHVEPSCLYGTEALDVVAELLDGIAPPSTPCSAGNPPQAAATPASPVASSGFVVEEAESTIAVAQGAADIPGASTINIDTSDTSASAEPPAVQIATITLLVVMAGIIAGSVLIVALRQSRAAPETPAPRDV